jgi:hypothetical protein
VEYNPCVASLRREPVFLDSTRLKATFSLTQAFLAFTFLVCSGQRTQGTKIDFVAICGLKASRARPAHNRNLKSWMQGAGVLCDCGELPRHMMVNMEGPDGVRGSGGFGLGF